MMVPDHGQKSCSSSQSNPEVQLTISIVDLRAHPSANLVAIANSDGSQALLFLERHSTHFSDPREGVFETEGKIRALLEAVSRL